MDITSFILGLKNGRDSVKTQEKTITPTENEIVVTPDTGYDALSKVTVEAVKTVGGGVTQTYFELYCELKSTDINTKIAKNFGFEPDLIVLIANKNTITGTKNFVYFGISQRYKEATGKTYRNTTFYMSSGKVSVQEYSLGIESTDTILPIHSADSTGFKLGKAPADGDYYLFAAKLC